MEVCHADLSVVWFLSIGIYNIVEYYSWLVFDMKVKLLCQGSVMNLMFVVIVMQVITNELWKGLWGVFICG